MFDSHLHDGPAFAVARGKDGYLVALHSQVRKLTGSFRSIWFPEVLTVLLFECWMFETNLRLLRFTTKLIP
jgi:hypothetical protein